MNDGRRSWRSRSILIIACVGVLVAGGLALVAAADDEQALSPADLDRMGELVRLWDESRMVPWPPNAYGRVTYTRAESAATQKAYRDLVTTIGTEEFQQHPMGELNVAAFMQAWRQSASKEVLLAYDCTVIDTELVKYDAGDVILLVKMWEGYVVGLLGPTQLVENETKYDQTPIWEARMRDTEEGWKIVGLRHRWDSEDLDPEQYGADTPHSMEYVPVELSGEP